MQPELGKIQRSEQPRDAVHVAIACVQAKRRLPPGARVNEHGEPKMPYVGIVDPYLDCLVEPEQWFWLFLYPNTVTGLRHDWTHPAFIRPATESTDDAKAVAKDWIEKFAGYFGMTASELIEHAEGCANGSTDFITEYGSEGWRDDWYEGEEQFWKHYTVLTGKAAPEEKPTVFSCSC